MKHFSLDEVKEIIAKYEYICGIDEVGRGCVAGPLFVCAVVIKNTTFLEGVRDSKKLSSKQRERLFSDIIKVASSIGFGVVSNDFIDQFGMSNSLRIAVLKALSNLEFIPQLIVTDFVNIKTKEFEFFLKNFYKDEKIIKIFDKISIYGSNSSSRKYIPIAKADDNIHAVSMASIIAKVTRDKLMKHISKKYPQYLWCRNKGYLTKEHFETIKKHGISPLHRKSFLKSILH